MQQSGDLAVDCEARVREWVDATLQRLVARHGPVTGGEVDGRVDARQRPWRLHSKGGYAAVSNVAKDLQVWVNHPTTRTDSLHTPC